MMQTFSRLQLLNINDANSLHQAETLSNKRVFIVFALFTLLFVINLMFFIVEQTNRNQMRREKAAGSIIEARSMTRFLTLSS